MMRYVWLAVIVAIAGCMNQTPPAPTSKASVPRAKVLIKPGENMQETLLTALIKAKAGTVIELTEGKFEFTASLSLTEAGVTIRGAGMDKTILSFKKQDQGKEGLLVSAGDFTMEELTVEDSKGDGIKVVGGTNVIFHHVRARWTGGEKETNGGYGLYPVQCTNVLIDGCEADGASDAGIYVGQSKNVIVKNCKAMRNVAGIEIENCTNADVFDNTATDNSGGILVFDLPNLPVKNGKCVRVFRNTSIANNHANFAPKGNMVGTVPPGTGMMILATDQVEVFENTIKQNQTVGLSIISFQLTQKPITDKDYDPYPEGIYIHDNTFAENGTKPSGELGLVLTALLGKPFPDIMYDGHVDPKKKLDGKLPENLSLKVADNGSATFANLNYDGSDILKFLVSKPKVERTVQGHTGKHPQLPVVDLNSLNR